MSHDPDDPPATGLDPALCDRLAPVGRLDGEVLPLGRTALALGLIACPGTALDPYEAHLAELAAAVGAAAGGGSADIGRAAAALSQVLADGFGYDGDREDYDDQQNANLIRVIDRRRGLPVALGILYAEAARAQGWALSGLSFPGHFLVRLQVGRERLVLDPFNAGRLIEAAEMRSLLATLEGPDATLAPQHYAAVGDRDILLRLQNNLKLRYLRAGALDQALAILDSMLLIAPGAVMIWRERGLLQRRLGHPAAAIADLQRFLAMGAPDDVPSRLRTEAAALITEIRRSLN